MSVSARATRSESRAGPLLGLACVEVVFGGVVCGCVDVARGAATESGAADADPSIAIVAKPKAPAMEPSGIGGCPKVDGDGEFDEGVFCSSMSFARKRRPAYVSETIVESDVAQRSRTTVEPQPVFRQDRPRTANVVDGTTRRNRR